MDASLSRTSIRGNERRLNFAFGELATHSDALRSSLGSGGGASPRGISPRNDVLFLAAQFQSVTHPRTAPLSENPPLKNLDITK